MTRDRDDAARACAEIREAIREILDGSDVPEERRLRVRDHGRECAACREFERSLSFAVDAVRALPEIPFPDDALEAVWSRTIARRPGPGWLRGWRVATAVPALAAVLLVAVVAVRIAFPPGPSPAELDRASAEARLVLGLTARAVHRAEAAAVDRVLVGEISPAIRRIPVTWPEAEPRRPQR